VFDAATREEMEVVFLKVKYSDGDLGPPEPKDPKIYKDELKFL
jgi:hypothetical protein